jgi:hypothetical protein
MAAFLEEHYSTFSLPVTIYFHSIAKSDIRSYSIAVNIHFVVLASQSSHASTEDRRRYQVPQSTEIPLYQSPNFTNNKHQLYLKASLQRCTKDRS